MPVAVLVTAALLTGGAAEPGQPPDDVLAAIDDATASAEAVPTLTDHRDVVPLGESDILALAAGAAIDIDAADGAIGLDLPLPASAEALFDEDGDLAVWSEDSYAVAVEELEENAVRAMFVLLDEDAPRQYPIDVDLPEDAELQLREDGSAAVVVPGGGDPTDPHSSDLVVAQVDVPWAVDAVGEPVPTHFTVDGATLTQHVKPTATTVYPVTADPLWLVPVAIAIARTSLHVAVRASASNAARAAARLTATRTTSGGFANIAQFKAAHGTRTGYHWHHIVEANRVGTTIGTTKVLPQQIHNVRNLVNIPKVIHEKCINSQMAKHFTTARTFAGVRVPANKSMRSVVQNQSWAKQHEMGLALLRFCGISV